MKILSIETSCDETAMALVKCSGTLKSPKFEVLENVVSSQIAIHRPFGGVVPNLAKREHIKNLPIVLRKILKSQFPISNFQTNSKFKNQNSKKSDVKGQSSNVDYIAVTVGPGLEPALWTGINFAEELAKKWEKPLLGANHMEGHLYSNWLPITVNSKQNTKSSKLKAQSSNIKFPAIALVVSGGHTILLHMTAINKWKMLGETVDDAAGEAFDKVARMLELPYPGGPEIQKLAAKGDPNAIKFPRPLLNPKNPKDKYNFSFSGLKTSVLYYLRDSKFVDSDKKFVGSDRSLADVAASFQQAVIDVLVKKTIRAAEEHKAKTILLCGGVSANKPLQDNLRQTTNDLRLKFVVPDFEFNTDNAAMIGAAAYIKHLQKKSYPIEADSNLNL